MSVAVGNFQVQITAVVEPDVLFGIGKVVGSGALRGINAVTNPPVVPRKVDNARTVGYPVFRDENI